MGERESRQGEMLSANLWRDLELDLRVEFLSLDGETDRLWTEVALSGETDPLFGDLLLLKFRSDDRPFFLAMVWLLCMGLEEDASIDFPCGVLFLLLDMEPDLDLDLDFDLDLGFDLDLDLDLPLLFTRR